MSECQRAAPRAAWTETPSGAIVQNSDSGTGSKCGVSTPIRARHPEPSGCQAFRSDPAIFVLAGGESKVSDPRLSAVIKFLLFITAPPYESTSIEPRFPFSPLKVPVCYTVWKSRNGILTTRELAVLRQPSRVREERQRVKPQGTEIIGSPSSLKGRVLCCVRISLARRPQAPIPLGVLVS